MEKLDFTKKYKDYYSAKAKPEIVDIEPAQYLSITGKGDPSGNGFSEKIQGIYSVAYAIKFVYKAKGLDFTVPKLEGLWWYDESKFGGITMEEAPSKISRSEWEYRLLIRMPELVSADEVKKGIDSVVFGKNIEMAKDVELFKMHEGKCVQMLHVGPFNTEIETLKLMNAFILKHGFAKNGHHHEIYLSDFRKTAPDKLKTILREPVK